MNIEFSIFSVYIIPFPYIKAIYFLSFSYKNRQFVSFLKQFACFTFFFIFFVSIIKLFSFNYETNHSMPYFFILLDNVDLLILRALPTSLARLYFESIASNIYFSYSPKSCSILFPSRLDKSIPTESVAIPIALST